MLRYLVARDGYGPNISTSSRRGAVILFWKPSQHDLEATLPLLSRWSATFEIPDLINYADYAAFPATAARNFGSDMDEPEGVEFFLYPKGDGGYRRMCLLSPRDLSVARVAAGYVGAATESHLRRVASGGVFSFRLASGPPAWTVHKNGYKRFRTSVASCTRRWDCSAMVRTDVASYYPSIDVRRLARQMFDVGCDFGPASFLLEWLMRLQDRHRVVGLPVGAEACGILGTFFLHPVDSALQRFTDRYFRYTDDIVYFVPSGSPVNLLDVLDEALAKLGLVRGVEKTGIYEDPEEAREAVEKRLLASLSNAVSNRVPGNMVSVRRSWVREVLEAPDDRSTIAMYRWFLTTFKNKRDPFALDVLTRDWTLFGRDPRVSSAYLAECGLDRQRFVDRAFEKLGRPAASETDAIDLHLLRVIGGRAWGAAEAALFRRVAADPERQPIIRAFAWRAGVRSHAHSEDEAMEAAVEEQNATVRRAATLTLPGKGARGRKFRLREIARRRPELEHTTEWLAAA